MKTDYLGAGSTHREPMTNYYCTPGRVYHGTRWMFLYGRQTLIEQVGIRPGDRVLEIGCGTGENFENIQRLLAGSGELIGIDCRPPMLQKARERMRQSGWKNVRLIDVEYGKETITRGRTDVVLFSYSLSMIPDWRMALACARSELWTGGRIGVVDFCKPVNSSKWFADWLALNRVNINEPYEQELSRLFRKTWHLRYDAWAGLWSFYVLVGIRNASAVPATPFRPFGRAWFREASRAVIVCWAPRLIQALQRYRELPPQALVPSIVNDVRAFSHQQQQDDIT